MLASTASFINAVGGFNGDVPTELTRFDIDTAVTTLMGANAMTVMDSIEGADKFGRLCAEVKSWVIDLESEVALS